jgi:S-adenosylmethionine-diacylgycerolhomoserine-N-methlytransferase
LIGKKYIKKIYGIDLCGSLLEVAKQRIKKMKMEDRVELIKADASKDIRGIKDSSVDVVTFSYSLTMIPDWKASLQVALKMLKPGNQIFFYPFF